MRVFRWVGSRVDLAKYFAACCAKPRAAFLSGSCSTRFANDLGSDLSNSFGSDLDSQLVSHFVSHLCARARFLPPLIALQTCFSREDDLSRIFDAVRRLRSKKKIYCLNFSTFFDPLKLEGAPARARRKKKRDLIDLVHSS